MPNRDRLIFVILTGLASALSVPYLLVKTGAWEPAAAAAPDAASATPFRDPDDLPVVDEIADFSMTDQSENSVGRADLLGKVWVADVIFTRCPGPCAKMTRRMADLQDSIPPEWPVRFVSVTTDPGHDSPEVLRRYAETFHADPARWSFLNAPKADVAKLAVDGLKLVVLDKEEARESPEDLFIHSTVLALVDKRGRLRGAFESIPLDVSKLEGFEGAEPPAEESWETTLKPRLLKAIERLVAED